ncbi:class I SAM-dependent methyltransferase [Sporohalobacter salinus]|uniref:class I SAM-dependent methyltransferase n=1 Tax=Sporohalobacter salinus TaxID=1494606 RepID=UPI0019603BBE|nr:class I SAM-dependent methyltransferase [Sporohalobacter salinus]MBM7624106.1 SAM-dependent methyltransferase [Sporohalobacter salinus]
MFRRAFVELIIVLLVRWPRLMESTIIKKSIVFIYGKLIADDLDQVIKKKEDYDKPIINALRYIKSNFDQPQKVLDLGTGTGFGVFKTKEIIESKEIIGVDLSKNMLEIARKKAKAREGDNIFFEQQDASDLSYESNSFDLLMSNNCPCYLKEVARVLKPSGLFLFTLSYSGEKVMKHKPRLEKFLRRHGFQINKMDQGGNGVYIIAELS